MFQPSLSIKHTISQPSVSTNGPYWADIQCVCRSLCHEQVV